MAWEDHQGFADQAFGAAWDLGGLMVGDLLTSVSTGFKNFPVRIL